MTFHNEPQTTNKRREAPTELSSPDLSSFRNKQFERGASRFKELLWIIVSAVAVRSFIPGNAHRKLVLRAFGAKIGRGVVIKPGVQIKFPWRLCVGSHSWIGENAWIDNLAKVTIGDNACISQGTYLCTGSHDWSSESFDLIVKPIRIGNGAWVAAKVVVAPGVSIGDGAVVPLGRVVRKDVSAGVVEFDGGEQRRREISRR